MEEIKQELEEYKKREQERTLLSEEEKEIQLDVEVEFLHDTEAFVEDYEEYPEDYHEDQDKLHGAVDYPLFPTTKKGNPISSKAGNMETTQEIPVEGATSYKELNPEVQFEDDDDEEDVYYGEEYDDFHGKYFPKRDKRDTREFLNRVVES